MSVERVVVPAEAGITHTTPLPVDQGVPDGFPAKFVVDGKPDYAKLAKSYGELEKAFSRGERDPVEPAALPSDSASVSESEKKVTAGAGDEKPAGDDVKSPLPGVEMDFVKEVSTYAWENGNLTDDHYAKLAAAGYDKALVDDYMAGKMAAVKGQNDAVLNAGGGQEAVDTMFAWAGETLSADKISWYDSKFEAGGADAIAAMEHLTALYKESGKASTPGRTLGDVQPGASGAQYTSTAQVQADMADPRYKTDPAYRKAVEQKIGRSNVL